ncbi:GIY-YIG nuclease family protein [Geomesophilobacter sediminis]|uniref:GIY-YIG nuclease family protein n=1 Tax=Geomesophilobacter sediminis TaxID=2798584 RepID=A0A8J7LYH0_9BACT|nr:GIY-YIG nuclease family protein [Geomesophilobacter sediminis]MBJ6725056.1 GIY-YIG nuclease family protein [Geomesophilobacter sediminis]
MWLYFIECRGGAIYTGIAEDVAERYQKHVQGKGAKYTRANPPVRFLAAKEFADPTEARKLEWQVKKLPREKKLAVIKQFEAEGISTLQSQKDQSQKDQSQPGVPSPSRRGTG